MLLKNRDIVFESGKGWVNTHNGDIYNCPGCTKIIYGDKKQEITPELQADINRGNDLDLALHNHFVKLKGYHHMNLTTRRMMESLVEVINCVDKVEGIEVFTYMDLVNQIGIKSPIIGFSDALLTFGKVPCGLNLVKVSDPEPVDLKDKLVLVDWKSKKSQRYNPLTIPNYIQQVSFYSRMIYQMYGITIDYALIAIAFTNGKPAHLCWIDRGTMSTCLNPFYAKAKMYYSNNNYWKGLITSS